MTFVREYRTVLDISRPWWFGLGISPDEKWLLYSLRDQKTPILFLVEPR